MFTQLGRCIIWPLLSALCSLQMQHAQFRKETGLTAVWLNTKQINFPVSRGSRLYLFHKLSCFSTMKPDRSTSFGWDVKQIIPTAALTPKHIFCVAFVCLTESPLLPQKSWIWEMPEQEMSQKEPCAFKLHSNTGWALFSILLAAETDVGNK